MAQQYRCASLLNNPFDRRQRPCYARFVGYFAILQGHIKIDANHSSLAAEVYILNRFLSHSDPIGQPANPDCWNLGKMSVWLAALKSRTVQPSST